jgi:uncharacterized protein DUF992
MRWAIAIVLCLLAVPASAAMQTDIGVLTCTLAEHGETDTEPESQTRAMLCSFKPKGTGPEESYSGEIKKVGSQTALSGKLVLIWAVMGPSDRKLKPAVLEQTFVGQAAPDSGDNSKTPKMLVGETDKAYGLQPITNDGHESNAGDSITVVALRLKSTPT